MGGVKEHCKLHAARFPKLEDIVETLGDHRPTSDGSAIEEGDGNKLGIVRFAYRKCLFVAVDYAPVTR